MGRVINSLQNFYGIAIRENQGKLYQMKKAVDAILYHCTDFEDDEKRHQYYIEMQIHGANSKRTN